MRPMFISRSNIITNGYLGLVLALLVVLSGLIFATKASANGHEDADSVQQTATLTTISIDVLTPDNETLPIVEWMGLKYSDNDAPQLQLRINNSETVTLDQTYTHIQPVEVTKNTPKTQAAAPITYHLRKLATNPEEEYEWQQAGSGIFLEAVYGTGFTINSSALESILASVPGSTKTPPQATVEATNTPPIQDNSTQAETQRLDLESLISQLDGKLTNQTGAIADLRTKNSELAADISDLNAAIKNQKPPSVEVIVPTDSGWISYPVLGLIVAILIAAAVFFYKRTTSTGGDGSFYIQRNLELEGQAEDARAYFRQSDKKIEELEEAYKALKSDSETLEQEKTKITNENQTLRYTLDKAQPYLDSQAQLEEIKTEYDKLLGELRPLVNKSAAAKHLLSGIVSDQIDDEEPAYGAAARLELLKGLKTALDSYEIELAETVKQSGNLIEEMENANAANQVEAVRQLINDRNFDSLTTIPQILVHMLNSLGRNDVDESVFSEIATYRRHLVDTFSPTNRTVPIAIIDLLERFCQEAQSGEIEALEKLTTSTIQALKPIYGPLDNRALNPVNSPQD